MRQQVRHEPAQGLERVAVRPFLRCLSHGSSVARNVKIVSILAICKGIWYLAPPSSVSRRQISDNTPPTVPASHEPCDFSERPRGMFHKLRIQSLLPVRARDRRAFRGSRRATNVFFHRSDRV